MKSEEAAAGKRRHHERSFKADLILQSLVPGASVSAIAMAGGVNANLLFKWRRDHLRTMRPRSDAVKLLPVQLASTTSDIAVASPMAAAAPEATGPHGLDDMLELELGDIRLRVRSIISESALVTLLRAMRRSA